MYKICIYLLQSLTKGTQIGIFRLKLMFRKSKSERVASGISRGHSDFKYPASETSGKKSRGIARSRGSARARVTSKTAAGFAAPGGASCARCAGVMLPVCGKNALRRRSHRRETIREPFRVDNARLHYPRQRRAAASSYI